MCGVEGKKGGDRCFHETVEPSIDLNFTILGTCTRGARETGFVDKVGAGLWAH